MSRDRSLFLALATMLELDKITWKEVPRFIGLVVQQSQASSYAYNFGIVESVVGSVEAALGPFSCDGSFLKMAIEIEVTPR